MQYTTKCDLQNKRWCHGGDSNEKHSNQVMDQAIVQKVREQLVTLFVMVGNNDNGRRFLDFRQIIDLWQYHLCKLWLKLILRHNIEDQLHHLTQTQALKNVKTIRLVVLGVK